MEERFQMVLGMGRGSVLSGRLRFEGIIKHEVDYKKKTFNTSTIQRKLILYSRILVPGKE